MDRAPESVLIGLRSIRETFELRFNRKAVLLKPGGYDASGVVTTPEYDPRWELWDTDSEGATYRVMRLQTGPDEDLRFPEGGQFKSPGQWLVDLLNFMNPARFNGDLNQMLHEVLEEPDKLREIGTEQDSDDLFEMVSKDAARTRSTTVPVLKTLDELAAEHEAWRAARGRPVSQPAATEEVA